MGHRTTPFLLLVPPHFPAGGASLDERGPGTVKVVLVLSVVAVVVVEGGGEELKACRELAEL